ncbi:helix-turn-helix domain-containing protein [Aeoliella sp.]|uniref:helix-turn-helix domain-containing protein n=1 Tax=Aeoliella sp. TaxID=2795800 RepID=UPI003CCBA9A9
MAKKKDDSTSYELNVEELKRLQLKQGITDAQLAKKVDVSERTLQRWLTGSITPRMENLYRLAAIFSVYPSALMNGGEELEPDPPYWARISVEIIGQVPAGTRKSLFAKVSESIARVLREADIDAMNIQTNISSFKAPPSVKTLADSDQRTIMLIDGQFKDGRDFWVFVAVKTGMYDAFIEAQRNNTLDLHNFLPYGEVISSGTDFVKGQPPPEVVAQVAELYKLPFSQLMQYVTGEVYPSHDEFYLRGLENL